MWKVTRSSSYFMSVERLRDTQHMSANNTYSITSSAANNEVHAGVAVICKKIYRRQQQWAITVYEAMLWWRISTLATATEETEWAGHYSDYHVRPIRYYHYQSSGLFRTTVSWNQTNRQTQRTNKLQITQKH